MSSRIPFIVTYKNPGTLPPVYIAGSFSDPEWQPQEMKHDADQDGEITFRSEVNLEPDKDYQFKLRIGDGDWWALSKDYPIVTDDAGNQNNSLKIPNGSTDEQIAPAGANTPAISLHHDSDTAALQNPAGKIVTDISKEDADDYKTPLFAHECLGAYESGEVVSDHETVPSASSSSNQRTKRVSKEYDTPTVDINDPTLEKENADDYKTPLFAHECLGAYEFGGEDVSDHETVPSASSSPNQRAKRASKEYDTTTVDIDDPTLEKFPSDRTSIMGALRYIQTHLDEDQTHLNGIPSSPRPLSSRRESIESSDDMSLSPMPISPTSTRRRESRQSHSSFGRARSPVSLGAIAEEPKPPTEEAKPSAEEPKTSAEEPIKQAPTISLPNPNSKTAHAGAKMPQSEEDEAVVMKHSQVKPNETVQKSWSSQSESNEPQNGTSGAEPDIIDAKSNGRQPPEAQSQAKAHGQPSVSTDCPLLQGDGTGRDGAMDTNAVDKWFRILFTQLFQRLPILLATGAVALAARIGWWKRADK